MMPAKILGLVAASLTTFSFFPQAIKVIRTKDTQSISLVMYIILNLGFILWLIYGLIVNDVPIILANLITLIPAITILTMKLLATKKPRE